MPFLSNGIGGSEKSRLSIKRDGELLAADTFGDSLGSMMLSQLSPGNNEYPSRFGGSCW